MRRKYTKMDKLVAQPLHYVLWVRVQYEGSSSSVPTPSVPSDPPLKHNSYFVAFLMQIIHNTYVSLQA